MEFMAQLANGVAKQFGKDCEVVIHDLTVADKSSTIVFIKNGHVTNRKLGDGPSHVVLEALKRDPDELTDHLDYITKTADGKILKSSTMYIRDEEGAVIGIFAINYDVTRMMMVHDALEAFAGVTREEEIERIPTNVNDLLDDLLAQSAKMVGKPVALMNKEDKVRAINFLNDAGALLITKSSEKICKFFDISKFTLYSYID